jgi:hypothetical protein
MAEGGGGRVSVTEDDKMWGWGLSTNYQVSSSFYDELARMGRKQAKRLDEQLLQIILNKEKEANQMQKFWRVMRVEEGFIFNTTYNNKLAARAYAEALAGENPGKTYVVLEAMSVSKSSNVTTVEL